MLVNESLEISHLVSVTYAVEDSVDRGPVRTPRTCVKSGSPALSTGVHNGSLWKPWTGHQKARNYDRIDSVRVLISVLKTWSR